MMGLPHDLFKIVRDLSTGGQIGREEFDDFSTIGSTRSRAAPIPGARGALDQSKRVAMGRFIEDTPRPARGLLGLPPEKWECEFRDYLVALGDPRVADPKWLASRIREENRRARWFEKWFDAW